MNTFNIYFDGGTNGKQGYGSWEVCWNGFSKKVSREDYFGSDYELPSITNNSAEYLALMDALIWIQSVEKKKDFWVKIHGDSQLVLFTLSGGFKTKKPHLKTFRDRCRKLLEGFLGFEVEWHGRIHNVRRFGH